MILELHLRYDTDTANLQVSHLDPLAAIGILRMATLFVEQQVAPRRAPDVKMDGRKIDVVPNLPGLKRD